MDVIEEPPNFSTNNTPSRNCREKQQLAMVLLSSKEQQCLSQNGLGKPALREFNTSKDFKTKFARQETMSNIRISSIRGGQAPKPKADSEEGQTGMKRGRPQSAKATRRLDNRGGDSESSGVHSLITCSPKSALSTVVASPARGSRPVSTDNRRSSSKVSVSELTGVCKTTKIEQTTSPIQLRISQRSSIVQHSSRVCNVDRQGFTTSQAKLNYSSSTKTNVCQGESKSTTVQSNRLLSGGVRSSENVTRPSAKRANPEIVEKIRAVLHRPLCAGMMNKAKGTTVALMSSRMKKTSEEKSITYDSFNVDAQDMEHDPIGTTSIHSKATDQHQNQGDGSGKVSPRYNKTQESFFVGSELTCESVRHTTSMENKFGDYEILENEILNNPDTDLISSSSYSLSTEAVPTREIEPICTRDPVFVDESKASISYIEPESSRTQTFDKSQLKCRARTFTSCLNTDSYQIGSRTSEASQNFDYKPTSRPSADYCSYSDTSLNKNQDTSSVHSTGTLSIITSSQSDMALTSDNVLSRAKLEPRKPDNIPISTKLASRKPDNIPISTKLISWKSQQRFECVTDPPVPAIIEKMLPFLNWSTAIIKPEVGLLAKDSLTAICLPKHCASSEVSANEFPIPSKREHSPRMRTTVSQFIDSGATESVVTPLISDHCDVEILCGTSSDDRSFVREPQEITLQETVEYLGDDCFEYTSEPMTPHCENVIIQLICNQVWSDDSDDERVDLEISNCTETFGCSSKTDTYDCSSRSDLVYENGSVMPCEEAFVGNVCILSPEKSLTYRASPESNRNDAGCILPYDGMAMTSEDVPLCDSNSSEYDNSIPCAPNNLCGSPIPACNENAETTFSCIISTPAGSLEKPTVFDGTRTTDLCPALSVHSQSTSTGDLECRARRTVLQTSPFKPFQSESGEKKYNKSASLNGNKKMSTGLFPRFTASCPGDNTESGPNKKFNQFNCPIVSRDVVNEKSKLAKNSSKSIVKQADQELCGNAETSEHLGNGMMKSVGVSCKIYAPAVARGRIGDDAGDRGKDNFAATKCGGARIKTIKLENRPRWR